MDKPTHIIKTYETNDAEMLFRASDGMMIGMREKVTVIFGDDPNRRVSRIFMESEHASAFLHGKVCQDDIGLDKDIIIQFINAESVIIQPGKTFAAPGTGSIHKLN